MSTFARLNAFASKPAPTGNAFQCGSVRCPAVPDFCGEGACSRWSAQRSPKEPLRSPARASSLASGKSFQ